MINNTIYEELRNFVKEHHGFGGDDLRDHPSIMQKYNGFMDKLRQLDNKRVKIKFTSVSDFFRNNGEKIGRIKKGENGKVKFYEGKRRTRFYYLDAGLFEGWFATLIPFSVEVISK